VVLASLWAGWFFTRGTAADSGPIILISIDTLRADHLPSYGYAKVATPAIDALAADGIAFESAWAHSPQTLPSHASIFTGRLPFEHGVRDNMGFSVKGGEQTLASLLRGRGFATGGFVSAYVLRRETGIAQGFDIYDDHLPPTSPEKATGEVQRDGADTLAAAEKWLDGLSTDRFFLFLHLYEPHSPYTPPARFARYDPYDGEIAYSDELVGRLADSLKRRGLYDAATIVLLSDHGEGLGDHGEMEHGIFIYGETIRIPLLIKLPHGRRAGRRVSDPVQHIDLVPTLLSMSGAPVADGLRGRSLVAAFDGQPLPEQGLYAEGLYSRFHFGWSELYALTDARYRFIRAPRDELYDRQHDPGERDNLSGSRETTRIAMRQALDRLISGQKIEAPAQVSASDREALAALGYVGMRATVSDTPGPESLPDPKDKVHVLADYRRGLGLVRDGKAHEAIGVFEAMVAENPGMADVWNEIAGLLFHQGRLDDALVAYKRIVETAPYDPAAIVSVAQLLVELGRLDEARAQAEQAVKMLPANEGRWLATAHKMLMRVALARHENATARAEAALAEQADPSFPLTDMCEGLIRYNAGEYPAALPYFEAALRKSAGRTFQMPDLRYYLGDTLGRLERLDEAQRMFNEELVLFPTNTRAMSGLAMVQRTEGRVEESNRTVEMILKRSPTPQGFELAERLWTMFGETERASAARASLRQAQATSRSRAPRRN
jgi:choline-sulfatase